MNSILYHPNRYLLIRDYFYKIINLYRNEVGSGLATMDALNKIAKPIISAYNNCLDKMIINERPLNSTLLNQEISYFTHFARFYIHGRNIFSFTPSLLSQFYLTDINNILFSYLKFPYNSFYIAFGKQKELNLWDIGYYIDGAYINHHDDFLQILLSTIRDDVKYDSNYNFIKIPDEYYYFSFQFTENTTIEDAIDNTIKNDSLFKEYDQKNQSGFYTINGNTVFVNDIAKQSNDIELQKKKDGLEIFKKALRLVVNSLCFLTTYKNFIEENYPDDTPKEFIDKLKSVKNKSQKRVLFNDMQRKGYSIIKFCGKDIERKLKSAAGTNNLNIHWRRGHWRNQAYGEQFKEHKLLWIMPVLVNRNKLNENYDINGHIYNVEE